ncbi:SMP-30/gluconolactonase/LRE family protein [Verticiella sediminum]|uniref:SMP-30/gluconolactonase/LRE family protein n=1 Tax=Verticiella sediminum TaxID=1247510 RepID=UPI001FEB11E8|nr:SMP-30/gluconolactonase/LRE family protein [Verticiella sediminum]
MNLDIERIGMLDTALGECPLWHPAEQRLWLLDCRAGALHTLDPADGATTTRHVPAPAGSFAFNADGRLVVALKEEVGLLDPATGELTVLGRIGDSHPNLRLNDGTALPDGSFLVGTMHTQRAEGEAPLGGLYRLAPDGAFGCVDTGYGVTNGPRVSPLDGRLYVCDSSVRRIDSYALAPDGSLAERRPFVHTDDLGSAPDGCVFDTEGGLWTALVHAGALVRFAPDTRVTHRIELPLTHPAALCFGGPELDEIYVTSIRDSGRLRGDGPLDGAVLRVRGVGMRGLPSPTCRIAG